MKTQSIGQRGETLAREYLEKQGFQFITANWRCKAGEIDLIMKEDSTLVLVEVRMRRPTQFGLGYETVAWQKQRKLIRAAKWYMQSVRWRGDARFDVVSIIDHPGRQEIDHIPNAFSGGF